ncbi:MAG TPA: hypothetical protein ENO08_07100 [Candidatus Eisenbacteria bacterium]|uniref:Tetratricopeptide repeat protein n=1 Tax=Eiseniibacteriota bacterium TaxID=2212470 RepID=A0A7V2F3R9_UNCEI|nr:hypothetical protein [Candidatus Eisenbacteria bacterium]
MVDFETISVMEAVEHIKARRAECRGRLEENNRLVMELIRLGRLKEAKKLIDEGGSRHYALFAKAEEYEKAGNLEAAVGCYWENIYVNGADASANYKRLMNLLHRIDCCEGELKVAEIYLNFSDRFEADEIASRISELRRMTASV